MEHETIRLRNCLGFEKRHSLLTVTQNVSQMRIPWIGVVYVSKWWMFCFEEENYFFSSLLCVWKDNFSGRNNVLYSGTGSIIETEFSLVWILVLSPVSANPVVNKPQNIHLLVVLGYKEWTLSGKPYEKCIYLLCTGVFVWLAGL